MSDFSFRSLLLLACLSLSAVLFAQTARERSVDFLQARATKLGVTGSDLADLRTRDHYRSPEGAEHIYLGQYHRGLPVFNAQASFHYRGATLLHRTDRLERNLAARAGESTATLTVAAVLANQPHYEFVEAELVYFPETTGEAITAAWQITVEDPQTGYFTLLLIDANDGRELYRGSLTLSCGSEAAPGAAAAAGPVTGKSLLTTVEDGSFYNVFPFGVESPLYGDRQLEFEPADSVASPFGWHDTNGRAGPEHTITRGNNVYAYRDSDEPNNRPDSGFVADGGPALDFDFPYVPFGGPDTNLQAALTQLFYTTNSIHDWVYHHGFNEAAGNFQTNNYGRDGVGGDAVLAEAQDNSGRNNANFTTRKDGTPPRMQMYLWNTSSVATIAAPADLAGERPSAVAAFGDPIGTQPTVGQLVVGRDGSDQPELGCDSLVNAAAVSGRVAMITRGTCFFQQKAFNAERAGAIAVVICNPENTLFTMGELREPNDFPVTVPTLMLRESDCIPLRQAIAAGEEVIIELRDNNLPPLDGSFDNGIVAHEYAHGISNRLVGGPANAFCLNRNEQMGEGWSDFFLLASSPLSVSPTPDGREPRGVANFSSLASAEGRGIRTQPYSTDFAINSHTYDDIITAALPHGLGEIWGAVLWDLYWALVDKYGFDEDLIRGKGGNNIAVRTVIEGMKLTPCNPGMVDARDAILIADDFITGGDNRCLLWEVFARRGLGYSAYQGSGDFQGDNQEAFDVDPTCIPTVKLTKSVDRTAVAAGDEVVIILNVRNDKAKPAEGITITDVLPPGLQYLPGSVRGADGSALVDGRLEIYLNTLLPDTRQRIIYRATTAADAFSRTEFFDGAETDDGVWETLSFGGNAFWERTDTTPYAGDLAWYLVNSADPQDQVLQLSEPVRIQGDRPALRFFTKYETEAGYDAGIVQVSTDGQNWENVDGQFLRHAYRGIIDDRGSSALRFTPTFWGDSRGYRDVVVDLSPYRGRSIYVRFRFVADEELRDRGWWIDNIEILQEVVNYDATATLVTSSGDRDTAMIGDLGILIDGQELIDNVVDPVLGRTAVTVHPNPATDLLTVSVTTDATGTGDVGLYAADGRCLLRRSLRLAAGPNAFDLPVAALPPGVYVLRVSGRAQLASRVVVIGR